MTEDQELKLEQATHKATIAKEMATLKLRTLKSRITRLLNSISENEENLKAHGLQWYPTWGHLELEAYFENRKLVADTTYVIRIEMAMRHYKQLMAKKSLNDLLVALDIGRLERI